MTDAPFSRRYFSLEEKKNYILPVINQDELPKSNTKKVQNERAAKQQLLQNNHFQKRSA